MNSPAGELASRRLIELLGREPRPAGSDAETRARAQCASFLRAHGFNVAEESFTYSAFAARWGVPLFGVYAGLCAATVIIESFSGDSAKLPAFVLRFVAFMGLFVPLVGGWSGPSRTTTARATNLVATRGSGAPDIWLAAHLDTKSQPVSMIARIAGTLLVLASVTVLVVLALVSFRYYIAPGAWLSAGVLLLLGALPLAASTVGSHSPGAVDNASGLTAVLRAVELEPAARVGVVVTSAEELGLQGARAWAASHRPAHGRQCIINCDTLDDVGRMRCMVHSKRDGELARRLQAGARAVGEGLVVSRAPVGVMLDSMAFRRGGWRSVSLARATLRTLARVHTIRDSADRLGGGGSERGARILAAFLREAM